MPKYDVNIEEVNDYEIFNVEADDEYDAIKKGWKILETAQDKGIYINESFEGDCVATEI
jgi:hypothetical protein